MISFDAELKNAIRIFWRTRGRQARKQGSATGRRDAGERSAVTGGKQMDGFVRLVRKLLHRAGVPKTTIYCNESRELPGFFRAEKQWDLLAVADDQLLAVIEFKSQVGPSFGNNYNNRAEEAIGNATDLLTAYREGAFSHSQRPWLGYLMLLEETPGSASPVGVSEPHFRVFEEFRGASYVKRYEILLTRLVRERLYDACCFLLSDRIHGREGFFRESAPELTFAAFASSLLARATAFAKTGK